MKNFVAIVKGNPPKENKGVLDVIIRAEFRDGKLTSERTAYGHDCRMLASNTTESTGTVEAFLDRITQLNKEGRLLNFMEVD